MTLCFVATVLSSSVQEKTSESVIVTFIITEGTSSRQHHGYLISSVQMERQDNCSAVFFVLCVLFFGSGHYDSVDLQTGTDCQCIRGDRTTTVHSQGNAVDTWARNSENTTVHIVAIPKVDELIFIRDHLVVVEGAEAEPTRLVGECNREGTATGWMCRGVKKKTDWLECCN